VVFGASNGGHAAASGTGGGAGGGAGGSGGGGGDGKGLHSFTFRLNVSTFVGYVWCMVFPRSVRQGNTEQVIKTVQVELKSGHV
jgi:hypothetical protein